MNEWEDQQWSRAVDNAIVLMSLLITRSVIRRFRAPRSVRERVIARLDALIIRYQDPTIAHHEQSPQWDPTSQRFA